MASYLLKERMVHFGRPSVTAKVLRIDERLISAFMDAVQAVTFKDLNDLETRMGYLQALSPETTARMRENVLEYYNSYLTPRRVVQRIEEGDYQKIYLQEEHYSVELLKWRLRMLSGPVMK